MSSGQIPVTSITGTSQQSLGGFGTQNIYQQVSSSSNQQIGQYPNSARPAINGGTSTSTTSAGYVPSNSLASRGYQATVTTSGNQTAPSGSNSARVYTQTSGLQSGFVAPGYTGSTQNVVNAGPPLGVTNMTSSLQTLPSSGVGIRTSNERIVTRQVPVAVEVQRTTVVTEVPAQVTRVTNVPVSETVTTIAPVLHSGTIEHAAKVTEFAPHVTKVTTSPRTSYQRTTVQGVTQHVTEVVPQRVVTTSLSPVSSYQRTVIESGPPVRVAAPVVVESINTVPVREVVRTTSPALHTTVVELPARVTEVAPHVTKVTTSVSPRVSQERIPTRTVVHGVAQVEEVITNAIPPQRISVSSSQPVTQIRQNVVQAAGPVIIRRDSNQRPSHTSSQSFSTVTPARIQTTQIVTQPLTTTMVTEVTNPNLPPGIIAGARISPRTSYQVNQTINSTTLPAGVRVAQAPTVVVQNQPAVAIISQPEVQVRVPQINNTQLTSIQRQPYAAKSHQVLPVGQMGGEFQESVVINRGSDASSLNQAGRLNQSQPRIAGGVSQAGPVITTTVQENASGENTVRHRMVVPLGAGGRQLSREEILELVKAERAEKGLTEGGQNTINLSNQRNNASGPVVDIASEGAQGRGKHIKVSSMVIERNIKQESMHSDNNETNIYAQNQANNRITAGFKIGDGLVLGQGTKALKTVSNPNTTDMRNNTLYQNDITQIESPIANSEGLSNMVGQAGRQGFGMRDQANRDTLYSRRGSNPVNRADIHDIYAIRGNLGLILDIGSTVHTQTNGLRETTFALRDSIDVGLPPQYLLELKEQQELLVLIDNELSRLGITSVAAQHILDRFKQLQSKPRQVQPVNPQEQLSRQTEILRLEQILKEKREIYHFKLVS